MPLYAYRCIQCGHRFEKIQNFSADPETVCPQCGGVLERPLTAPRLHFKGAGWYINDYASKSSAPAAESGPESGSKSDAKPDSKSESGGGETKKPSTASEGSATAPAATPPPAPSATPGSSS